MVGLCGADGSFVLVNHDLGMYVFYEDEMCHVRTVYCTTVYGRLY